MFSAADFRNEVESETFDDLRTNRFHVVERTKTVPSSDGGALCETRYWVKDRALNEYPSVALRDKALCRSVALHAEGFFGSATDR